MSEQTDGGPEFPRQLVQVENSLDFDGDDLCSQTGMSLRAWFAGQALAGLTSRESWPGRDGMVPISALSSLQHIDSATGAALAYADALIAKLGGE